MTMVTVMVRLAGLGLAALALIHAISPARASNLDQLIALAL
jgi:hypothetical protein